MKSYPRMDSRPTQCFPTLTGALLLSPILAESDCGHLRVVRGINEKLDFSRYRIVHAQSGVIVDCPAHWGWFDTLSMAKEVLRLLEASDIDWSRTVEELYKDPEVRAIVVDAMVTEDGWQR